MGLKQCLSVIYIVCLAGIFEACSNQGGFDDPQYENCLDQDGDKYGENCMLGPDCDDGDPSLNFSCDCEAEPLRGCPCNGAEEKSCFESEARFVGVGNCRSGTRYCENGNWGACMGQQLPKDEVCDQIDNDCDSGTDEELNCDPNGPPICDEMNLAPGRVPPNLLLVVDRSSSMSDPARQGGTGTKLQDTQQALSLLLDDGEGKIRFGWLQYPGSDVTCDPGTVTVECSDESVAEIRTMVNDLATGRGTPTGESLQHADTFFQNSNDTTHPNFVVLLTDGIPTCPLSGGAEALALQAVQELYEHGIETFVIGLGEDLNSSNPDLLNHMAVAGGRPRTGTAESYYAANSMEELQSVLQSIGGVAIGCKLTLNPKPQYPKYLWVYIDGVEMDRDMDHLDGWDYDEEHNQIVFYGPACEQIKDKDVSKVEIKMGCAPPD